MSKLKIIEIALTIVLTVSSFYLIVINVRDSVDWWLIISLSVILAILYAIFRLYANKKVYLQTSLILSLFLFISVILVIQNHNFILINQEWLGEILSIDFLVIFSLLYFYANITRTLLQFIFAYLNNVQADEMARKELKSLYSKIEKDEITASIIFPIYNESRESLELVAKHVLECVEELPFLEVIFVDDGSTNREEVMPVYKTMEKFGVKVLFKENSGKREAQMYGLDHTNSEYIITVDSDTIISAYGVVKILAALVHNSRLGAVTGDIKILNWNESWLTHIMDKRYWLACNVERAAQSYSGSMMCCSGAFAVYRRDVLLELKEQYLNQYFLGQKCTYGDDRHLTNLVLSLGYETAFQPDAVCYTYSPATIPKFIAQQTRWSQSFYREFFWTLKYVPKISVYGSFDTLLQPFLLFALMFNLALNVYNILASGNFAVIVYIIFTIILMGFLKALYGALLTKDLSFLSFSFYGFIHLFIITPFRIKALLSLSNTKWGTRGGGGNNFFDIFAWIFFFWGMVFFLATTLFHILKDQQVFTTITFLTSQYSFADILEKTFTMFTYYFPYFAVILLFNLATIFLQRNYILQRKSTQAILAMLIVLTFIILYPFL